MPNNMLQNDQKKIVYSLIQGKDGAAWASKVYFGWNLTSTGESSFFKFGHLVVCSKR